MKCFRAIFIAFLISMITASAYGATPQWIPLYVSGGETVYIDEANFSSNLNTHTPEVSYRLVYWIRQKTPCSKTYLEYQTILETGKEPGIIRYRTVQSRYTGKTDGIITSANYSGWERIASDEPIARVFREVWAYDQRRNEKKKVESPQELSGALDNDTEE